MHNNSTSSAIFKVINNLPLPHFPILIIVLPLPPVVLLLHLVILHLHLPLDFNFLQIITYTITINIRVFIIHIILRNNFNRYPTCPILLRFLPRILPLISLFILQIILSY